MRISARSKPRSSLARQACSRRRSMLEDLLLFAQSAASPTMPSPGVGAIAALVLFIAASVWLGTIAQRVVERSRFIQGYFQGNRGLGAWTIALTATVQSGGTFMG